MKGSLATKLNSLVVSCYKVIGFAALVGILLGLASYLSVHAFFFVSESWVAPIIISSSDEEVIRLFGHVAEQQLSRDRAMAEIRSLRLRLADAVRTLDSEKRFHQRFMEAVQGDRSFRAQELRRLHRILEASRSVRSEMEDANRAFGTMARARADELLRASLVDREEYLTVKHQIAQMARTNLSLAEAEASLEGRIAEIRNRAQAIDTSFLRKGGSAPANIDVLLLEREYLKSVLVIAKAEEEVEVLRQNLAAAEQNLATYDELLLSIRNAPRVKAIERKLTVAFVPYENLDKVVQGAPVYGCTFGVLLCERVGFVSGILEGEVNTRHPVRNRVLRGVLVEVDFSEPRWAQRDVLHVGGRPLIF